MRKASLEDLYREKWLRERNNDEIRWTTKDGKEISLRQISDTHLDNIINHLIHKEELD